MSNPLSRSLVSRLLFGVTSIGALGLLYLYYNYRRRSNAAPDNSKRKRRIASGSGEAKNRVTFAEQNEIIGFVPTSSSCTRNDEEDDDLLVGAAKAEVSSSCPIDFNPEKLRTDKVLSDPEEDDDEYPTLEDEMVTHDTDSTNLASPNTSANVTNGTQESPKREMGIVDLMFGTEEEYAKANGGVKEEVALPSPLVPVTASPPKPQTPVKEEEVKIEPVLVGSNGHPIPNPTPLTAPESNYDQPNSMVRQMHIPRDHVPGLIGKKGANIRMIQYTSNTTINFQDETMENGDRICMIRGTPQDVTLAESLIEKYILEQPVVTTTKISVPLSSVGRIIGKGGETIRGIQDMSKARVTVDSGINHYRGPGDATATRSVIIKGTEDQIAMARDLILEKVEEEKALRRNIDMATQNRTPRRPTSTSSNSPGSYSSNNLNGNDLPLKTNGVMEVFVSCAYHPNNFWIQVRGQESIELDKLTEAMTEYYSRFMDSSNDEFSVGDIIAAPFDVDGKMYRGKILKLIGEDEAEIVYVDFGDKRVVKRTFIQRIHPEFLALRYQAIQATLNLGCIGDRWTDEAISEFCDLTHCAQWQPTLTARVKDYLKDPEDQKDTIWVELLDKNLNIGDELIRRNRAKVNDVLPGSTTKTSSNSKKSYAAVAAVVAEEPKSSNSSEVYEANGEATWGEEDRNGN